MLQLKDFDYNLPPDLIAQKPALPRDHSRLLLLNRKTGATSHKHFYDLPDYLRAGDVLVLNNTKVFPARLLGYKKETGGGVEVFLLRVLYGNLWECLARGRVKEGAALKFKGGLEARVMKNNQDGTWQVKFNLGGQKFWRVVGRIGLVPLPPYIKRAQPAASDKQNYQTVFADPHRRGSVAAPTAGLHFTKALLKKIKARGVKIVYVTLHVGLGTFAPVKVENIKEHKMHVEWAEINAAAAAVIMKARKEGRRVIAVGTTSCRTLESARWPAGKTRRPAKINKQSFWTGIFIYPGYRFKVTDALVTNFHLPKSTLLMLVSALAGKRSIDRAYKAAVSQKYRFFSYGDAMFIY